MILRTDLYAAIRLQDRLQQTKKADQATYRSLIGLFLFLLVAAGSHYFYMVDQVNRLRPEAEAASNRASKIQKDLQSAQERIDQQHEKVSRRTALLAFANNRLSWAPVLEAVFEVTPPYIEMKSITGISANQESNKLVISGRTATRNSRLDCDKYRLLLVEALSRLGHNAEGKFAHLEEIDAGVKTGNAFLLTTFDIELTWNTKSDGR